MKVEVRSGEDWVPVCGLADLTPGRGVAALLPDGAQVAVFLDRHGRTYAVGNRDPFTGAYVLSRGLLGSTGNPAGAPFVASPLLKQRFDLSTGRCLDDPEHAVPVYATRVQ
jgi:nitrite reductase (NADH) small subunit